MDGIISVSKPASDTATLLHTGVASTRTHFQVVCCNISGSASNCKVYLQASGETLPVAAKELVYQANIGANSSQPTIGLCIEENERIIVESDTGTVTFTCTGGERAV
jgi:hypothetical protein